MSQFLDNLKIVGQPSDNIWIQSGPNVSVGSGYNYILQAQANNGLLLGVDSVTDTDIRFMLDVTSTSGTLRVRNSTDTVDKIRFTSAASGVSFINNAGLFAINATAHIGQAGTKLAVNGESQFGDTMWVGGGSGEGFISFSTGTNMSISALGTNYLAIKSPTTLRLETNGTERVRVTQTGDVGINVVPTVNFHIVASTSMLGNTVARVQNAVNTANINITDDGNIYVNAPQYAGIALQVAGANVTQIITTGADTAKHRLPTDYTFNRKTDDFILGGKSGVNWFFQKASGVAVTPTAKVYIQGEGSTSATTALEAVNDSNTSILKVRNDGNVGIGTASPLAKLQVFDSTQGLLVGNSTGGAFANTAAFGLGSTYSVIGFINGTDVGSTTNWLWNIREDGGAGQAGFWKAGTIYAQISAKAGTSRLLLKSDAGVDKFAVDGPTGDVFVGNLSGVGTRVVNVDSAGMLVAGVAASSAVDGSGTANYVPKWSDSNTLTNSIIYDAGTNIGIGTATPLASSKLDVTSTTSGVLLPRMTTTQRNAITSPATSLLIFNTTTNRYEYYNGTAWVQLTPSTAVLTNNRILYSSSGSIAEIAAQTQNNVSFYDANGLPTGNAEFKLTTANGFSELNLGAFDTNNVPVISLTANSTASPELSAIVFNDSTGTMQFEMVYQDGGMTMHNLLASGGFTVSVDNTVTIGSSSPVSSQPYVLDVTWDGITPKGMLIPRMTEAERDSIATPTAGLYIYNTDTNLFNYYNGTAWVVMSTGSGVATSKYTTSFTPGTEGVANTITHSLGTAFFTVQLWDVTTGKVIYAEIGNATSTQVDITFNVNPAGNVRIVVIG